MRRHTFRSCLGVGLTLLLGSPAWAFDVDRFLVAAAKHPQADITAAEAAVETTAAQQTALMPPWQLSAKQEGLGPTEAGNQVSYLTLEADVDAVGLRATQSRAQVLRAESLQQQSRQVRLDQQLQDLANAWRVLALREQLRALDGALADLPAWKRRISLRVEAGKLPGMMLTRILGVEAEWRAQRLTMQRELATTEPALAARGLLALVEGPLPALQALPKAPEPAPWPEAVALETEERSLQLAEEAARKQAIPQTSVLVEGERYNTFSAGQHTVGLGFGLSLPNLANQQLELQRVARQRQLLTARRTALQQRQQALTGRFEAMRRTGLAEWAELQHELIPNLDRQAKQTLSLVERGLSDVWPWVDLRRTQLDASLRAIDAQAAALEGGYGLWLLATGSSSH